MAGGGAEMTDEFSWVTLPDGRRLEFLRAPHDRRRRGGTALVVHAGTPNAAAGWSRLTAAAERNGLDLIAYSRPGYGQSDSHPGRRIADAARDTAALLDALGIDEFVSLGISGGGPHVLACAALLPGRCRAIADVCGLAPGFRALHLGEGMSETNSVWFDAAERGIEALAPFGAMQMAAMGSLSVATMTQLAQSTMPPVDAAACTGDLAQMLTTMLRRAFETGPHGYLEDSLAFVAAPGFNVADIRCPTSVWHGALDVNVPQSHSRWLLSQLPHARAHLFEQHGHLSLLNEVDDIVDELAQLGRSGVAAHH